MICSRRSFCVRRRCRYCPPPMRLSSRICRGARSCSSGNRPRLRRDYPGPYAQCGPARDRGERRGRQPGIHRLRPDRVVYRASRSGGRPTKFANGSGLDAPPSRERPTARTRMVLPLCRTAHGRARLEIGIVHDRHRATAGGSADGATVLCFRRRDRADGAGDLRACRFRLDARPRHVLPADGMEAGERLFASDLGRVPRERNSDLLGIGSPRHPSPCSPGTPLPGSGGLRSYRFVGSGPLFTHQFSHAWLDFRGIRDGPPFELDYFENSVTATRAHRDFA